MVYINYWITNHKRRTTLHICSILILTKVLFPSFQQRHENNIKLYFLKSTIIKYVMLVAKYYNFENKNIHPIRMCVLKSIYTTWYLPTYHFRLWKCFCIVCNGNNNGITRAWNFFQHIFEIKGHMRKWIECHCPLLWPDIPPTTSLLPYEHYTFIYPITPIKLYFK